MTQPGNPDTMRAAAAHIEAASNAVHALQTILTERINAASVAWSPETTSEFMRVYLGFDRDISRIQASLDEMHSALAVSCTKAKQEVTSR